jgi:hypothetical protein
VLSDSLGKFGQGRQRIIGEVWDAEIPAAAFEPPLYDGVGETIVNADPISGQPDNASGSAGRAFLWVALALAVVYLPIFLGQIVFFRDIAHWIFPARVFVRDSLLHAELPAWNPYQGLGFSVPSDPLYGVFYPPNWLFLLVGPNWVGAMITWQDFAHLVWGSAGVFWLARRFRATPVSAVIATLSWALSGYVTSQWTAGLRLHAAAWIPWAAVGHLALLDRLRAGGRRWRLGVVQAALPTACALLMGELFLAMMGVGFALMLVAATQRSRWPCCSPAAWRPSCWVRRARIARELIARHHFRARRPRCILCTRFASSSSLRQALWAMPMANTRPAAGWERQARMVCRFRTASTWGPVY